MNILELTGLLFAGAISAGLLGSLTGLGGGVVLVPLLTLVFGVDLRYAIGASLISVIATSSGAAVAYLREGYTNLRVGLFLLIATTLGALAGAVLTTLLRPELIAVIFGLVLLYSAYQSLRRKDPQLEARPSHPLARRLGLEGSYPENGKLQSYRVYNVPAGFGLMVLAGILSGLLGIGSGAVKVLAMDQAMGLPYKVSATTSNFMIGVTAAASAGIYLSRGYVEPGLTMPVMLGVLFGAVLGARILVRAKVNVLRLLFSFVILFLAVQMIAGGLTGRI